MKINRLPGRKNAAKVLAKGRLWRGNTLTVRWMPGAPKHPLINPEKVAVYVGTFASTKLDKSAVRRNRMRRRCREALRTELKNQSKLPTIQLLLSPRSRSLECDFAEIVSDVRAFLSSVR
jgi:ribonuclease P protein component